MKILIILILCLPHLNSLGRNLIYNNEIKACYETWSLTSENLGMAGWSFNKNSEDNAYLGMQTWMAIEGDRGGFITLGFDGGYKYQITSNAFIDLGAYIGAGGGRGGYFLSGGGLMLRPHISFLWSSFYGLDLGAGISYVVFPSDGSIESFQPFIQLSLPYEHRRKKSDIGTFELSGFKSMGMVGRHIFVDDGVKNESDNKQLDFSLVGIEAHARLNDNLYLKVEAEGAAQGESTGYMQILGGFGTEWKLYDSISLFSEFSIGGAGGGGVSTGGGLLLDLSAGARIPITDKIYVGASIGHLNAPDGDLSGETLALKIGYSPTLFKDMNSKLLNDEIFANTRIRYAYQHYLKADDQWRSHHEDENVGNIGVQLDTFLTDHWYLTGQGFAAATGNAGAYMTGLLGLGYQFNINKNLFFSSEVLLGAAGGGGLRMGSGSVVQANFGGGIRLSEELDILLQLGRLSAFDGPFAADIIGLSFQHALDW